MIIGVPKEIKKAEFRVALTPAGVKALSEAEHKVLVERGAGGQNDNIHSLMTHFQNISFLQK